MSAPRPLTRAVLQAGFDFLLSPEYAEQLRRQELLFWRSQAAMWEQYGLLDDAHRRALLQAWAEEHRRAVPQAEEE